MVSRAARAAAKPVRTPVWWPLSTLVAVAAGAVLAAQHTPVDRQRIVTGAAVGAGLLLLSWTLLLARLLRGRRGRWAADRRTAEARAAEVARLAAVRAPAIAERRRAGLGLGPDDVPGPLSPAADTGEEFAADIASIVAALGSDEAVRRERALRDAVQAAFESVARHMHAMATVQQQVLDEVEQSIEDPGLMAGVMRADHAAAQMTRKAQTLLVMCGVWPARRESGPVSLYDCVRGAQSRIVEFGRVEVHGARNLYVVPPAVEGVMHTIAELLENATVFSPSRSRVVVTVREVGSGAVVEIDDAGVGMPPDVLERAAARIRDELDLAELGAVPRLGLACVGRWTRELGFGVELSGASAYGGTRAVAFLPYPLLTEPLSHFSRGSEARGDPDYPDYADYADTDADADFYGGAGRTRPYGPGGRGYAYGAGTGVPADREPGRGGEGRYGAGPYGSEGRGAVRARGRDHRPEPLPGPPAGQLSERRPVPAPGPEPYDGDFPGPGPGPVPGPGPRAGDTSGRYGTHADGLPGAGSGADSRISAGPGAGYGTGSGAGVHGGVTGPESGAYAGPYAGGYDAADPVPPSGASPDRSDRSDRSGRPGAAYGSRPQQARSWGAPGPGPGTAPGLGTGPGSAGETRAALPRRRSRRGAAVEAAARQALGPRTEQALQPAPAMPERTVVWTPDDARASVTSVLAGTRKGRAAVAGERADAEARDRELARDRAVRDRAREPDATTGPGHTAELEREREQARRRARARAWADEPPPPGDPGAPGDPGGSGDPGGRPPARTAPAPAPAAYRTYSVYDPAGEPEPPADTDEPDIHHGGRP